MHGKKCKFSHDPKDIAALQAIKAKGRGSNNSKGSERVLCKFFKEGRCFKGWACGYSHAAEGDGSAGLETTAAETSMMKL